MSYLFNLYGKLPKYHLDAHLVIACANGQLNHIKYLLNSPELIEKADIHTENDAAFIGLCYYGYLDCSSHVLLKKISETKYYSEADYENTLKFLIFDINIEKTIYIKDFVESLKMKNIELFNMINHMFTIREIKKELEIQLQKKE